MIATVGEEELAIRENGDGPWVVELGGTRVSIVAGKGLGAVTGEGGDDARGRDATEAMVVEVDNKEIAEGVGSNVHREIEECGAGRTIVTGKARRASAGQCRDKTGRDIDATDAVVQTIGNQEVAETVEGETGGHPR